MKFVVSIICFEEDNMCFCDIDNISFIGNCIDLFSSGHRVVSIPFSIINSISFNACH